MAFAAITILSVSDDSDAVGDTPDEVSVTMSGYTYGQGENPAAPVVTKNTAGGATLYYATVNTYIASNVASSATAWPVSLTSTAIPAGEYYVYAVTAGDETYADGFAVSASTFTVAKAAGSVTVAADQELTYTGSAPAIEYSANTGEVSFAWFNTAEESIAAPTAPGSYKVKVTAAASTNYNEYTTGFIPFTIAQKEVTISGITANNKVYDGTTAATLVYTGVIFTGIVGGDELTVTATGAFADANAANGKTVTISGLTLGGTSMANYVLAGSGHQTSTTANITKANPVITAPVAATPTYSGSAQNLVTAGSSEHGSFTYSTTESGVYDASVPQGTNAGNYTVWYKFTGDANHNDIAATQVASVTIAKATDSWATGPAVSKAWGSDVSATGTLVSGTAPVFRYYTTGDRDEEIPNWEWATAGSTVYVKVTTEASDNYLAFTDATISFVVAKGTPAVTAPTAAVGLIYNGSALALVSAGSTTGGTLQYSTDGGANWSASIPQGTAASDYAVLYRVLEDTNWNGVAAAGPVNVTIAKASVAIPVAADGLIYNGSSQIGVADGDNYSVSNGSATDAGNYTATVSLDDSANYQWSDSTVADKEIGFTIAKASASIETAPVAHAAQTYSNTSLNLVGNSPAANGGTIMYYTAAAAVADQAALDAVAGGSWIATATETNAGTYYVYYKIVGDANHNDLAPLLANTFTATINKAPSDVVVSAVDGLEYNTVSKNLVYVSAGNMEQSLQYSYKFGDGDFSGWAGPIPQFTNAGAYTVKYQALESANYLASAEGTVNVTVARSDSSFGIAPTAHAAQTFDGTSLNLVGNSPVANGGTIMYYTAAAAVADQAALDAVAGGSWIATATETNAGTYYVYYKIVGDANHNDLAPLLANTFTATINKADAVLSGPPTVIDALVWTGEAQNLVNAGTATGGELQYSTDGGANWSASIPQGTAAGDYAVLYKVVGDANHNDVAQAGPVNVTIAKADAAITVLPVKIDGLVHTGSAQNLVTPGTATGGELQYSLDGTVYSASIPQGTDIATYTVYFKVVGDANHNDTVPQTTTVDIAPAPGEFYYVSIFYHSADPADDETDIPIPTATIAASGFDIAAADDLHWDGIDYTEAHYHMVGFNSAAAGTGLAYAFGINVTLADFQALDAADGNVDYHVTLHMIWAIDQYTVTISGTGAAGVTVTAGQTVIASGSLVDYGTTLTAVIADKTGYVKSVTPAEVVVAANVEFVGTYTPVAYTITFNKNADAATGDMAVLNATYDVDVVLTENAFVRTGFVFGGWATAADGAAVYNDKATVKNLIATDGGNVNLYVVWVEVKTEGGTASIDIDTDAVSDQAAQQLVDGAIADANVNTVDISASKTDSVSIKSDAIKAASDANLNVNIETKNGTMEFPAAALKDKVAAGTTVKSEIKEVAIPDAYVNQVPAGTKVFSITLTAGDTAITQFGDVFTVKVKYDPAGATDGLYVAYLANDGTLQKMEGSYYENGYMVFTTNHLSEYAILDEHVDSASSTFVLLMAAIVAICVVLVAVAVSMPLTKKDDE